ncbi:hypothetical protein V1477_003234 [Vespula maculifrons]|uniref:Uncharacterized protein n=1 Tax=Vespula maculifrons TaxID=7453 RepID=A0ABD2CU99_VESMC
MLLYYEKHHHISGHRVPSSAELLMLQILQNLGLGISLFYQYNLINSNYVSHQSTEKILEKENKIVHIKKFANILQSNMMALIIFCKVHAIPGS